VLQTGLPSPFAGTWFRLAVPKVAHQREFCPGLEGFSDAQIPPSNELGAQKLIEQIRSLDMIKVREKVEAQRAATAAR
jgi:hypothetical protein